MSVSAIQYTFRSIGTDYVYYKNSIAYGKINSSPFHDLRLVLPLANDSCFSARVWLL